MMKRSASPLAWFIEKGGMASFVAARHRLIDDLFLEAFESGVRQVVNLGCGFDGRLARFAEQFRQGRYFEVDHPDTFRLKSYMLQSLPDDRWKESTVRVPVDFERDDLGIKLRDAGFSSTEKTFVFWEGVTYYLQPMAVHGTLATLSKLLPSGSQIGFDYWNPEIRLTRRSLPILSQHLIMRTSLQFLGEPLKTSFSQSQLALGLATHGFKLREHYDSKALKRRYLGADQRRKIFNQMPVVLAVRS
jgi:methyltransferase (TIGR00027 family)